MGIRNGTAQKKLRMRFRDKPIEGPRACLIGAEPTRDCGRDEDTHHIVFHRGAYDWGEDDDGHLHVAAKRAAARTTDIDDRISDGVEPDTEKRLREKQPERIKKLLTQAEINKANADFWKRKDSGQS